MRSQWWQSLEELEAGSPNYPQAEFPQGSADPPGPDRRAFLKLMGASAALATLTSCGDRDHEAIVPYAQDQPFTPGVPVEFATAITLAGYAVGVVVKSREGRPVKIEGNPDHPASLGGTDAFTQAALLSLYDLERSQAVRRGQGTGDGHDHVSTFEAFRRELQPRLDKHRASQGRGLSILTGAITSPSTLALLNQVLDSMPQARWHRHEPLEDVARNVSLAQAAGRPASLLLDLTKADVIVSFGDDFLAVPPANIRYSHDFASRRRVRAGSMPSMTRLYCAESNLSLTGANADHRIAIEPSRLPLLVLSLSSMVAPAMRGGGGPALSEDEQAWCAAAAQDLAQAGPNSLLLAGPGLSPALHELVLAVNAYLGSMGVSMHLIDPADPRTPGRPATLGDLAAAIDTNEVETLLIIDANPAYDAPGDLHFAASLARVPVRVHMGLYHDETAALCQWHIPRAHDLEAWSDARAFDGTACIIQPLIAPLYGGRTIQELLATLRGDAVPRALDLVRAYWQAHTGLHAPADFDAWWRTTLRRGTVEGTSWVPSRSAAPANPSASPAGSSSSGSRLSAAIEALASQSGPATFDLELCLVPDPTIHDGRFANNAWLQELPKPITKLTWDNALLISPKAAHELGLTTGDLVELIPTSGIRASSSPVEAPIFVQPGHADRAATLSLGYGRTRAGSIGNRGVNAYALRPSDSSTQVCVRLAKTHRRYDLATTQGHYPIDEELVRQTTVQGFLSDPSGTGAQSERTVHLSMYPRQQYTGTQWGMSIDTGLCTGCSACLIACQAENNIPVVGREEVRRTRTMHWIRIDRYYNGPPASPRVLFAPIPCMHCEDAPCELVCPVGATQHSEDGLNEMVYNRCIGTRYCSNNCPYKVRRFNFFRYAQADAGQLELMRNPEVSVRSRGVMEKCTYCVQRIRAAEVAARKDNRPIRRAEVVTACQQACPAAAITFGNITDLDDPVARDKAQPHSYAMLAGLNTHPRTTYLAAVRNPSHLAPPLSPQPRSL